MKRSMQYSNHGGHCCGYGHIHGFDSASIEQFEECISQHERVARGNNRILECILTNRQLTPAADDIRVTPSVRERGGWANILREKGFRLSAQWRNSNTGRNCYQFLLINSLLTDREGYAPPFQWEGPVLSIPPIENIRREVPFTIGDSYRILGNGEMAGSIGICYRITDNHVYLRIEENRPVRLRKDRPGGFRRIVYIEGGGGNAPAPVDPTRPVAIKNHTTGEIIPATIIGRGPFACTARAMRPSITLRDINLSEGWSYEIATGDWEGDPQVGRLFNPGIDEEILVRENLAPAPAPAPAPEVEAALAVASTEFYASLRGTGRRGPFDNIEAAREAYPRCRRFTQRQIMSDGTSVWTNLP